MCACVRACVVCVCVCVRDVCACVHACVRAYVCDAFIYIYIKT